MTAINRADTRRGFTLLIAVVTVSIVLAMGVSILNITLKEFILANIARDSEVAFYAADAGMECALYWDESTAGDKFKIGVSPTSVSCMGAASNPAVSGYAGGATANIDSGETGTLTYSWGTPALCAVVKVTKVNDGTGGCLSGTTCTTVVSRGYNRSCAVVNAGSDMRTVERRLRSRY